MLPGALVRIVRIGSPASSVERMAPFEQRNVRVLAVPVHAPREYEPGAQLGAHHARERQDACGRAGERDLTRGADVQVDRLERVGERLRMRDAEWVHESQMAQRGAGLVE